MQLLAESCYFTCLEAWSALGIACSMRGGFDESEIAELIDLSEEFIYWVIVMLRQRFVPDLDRRGLSWSHG